MREGILRVWDWSAIVLGLMGRIYKVGRGYGMRCWGTVKRMVAVK